MEHKRVFAVIDRIAHQSTSKLDREQSVAALQRLLKGKMPSDVLQREPAAHRSYDVWQEQVDDLKEQVAEAIIAKNTSEKAKQREIKLLDAKIARLEAQIAERSSPKDGWYSRVQVKNIMSAMFPKDHGLGKALVEKNAAMRQSGSDVPKITDSLLQKWQRDDRYPAWFVEQLKTLSPDDLLPKHRWTMEQKDYATALAIENPCLTNQQIADACNARFGCKITDSAIRGVLNRARLLRPKIR